MTSQPHEPETVDLTADLSHYRDLAHRLESQVVAVRAVVNSGEPDWRRRCEGAAATLRGLLNVPGDRAGSWEAQHVSALDEPLRDVLAVLDGADR